MPEGKDFLVKIGDYVGEKAKAKFKSNAEFANVCNINESPTRRILQGKQNISLKVFEGICEALDIKMSELLKGTGK